MRRLVTVLVVVLTGASLPWLAPPAAVAAPPTANSGPSVQVRAGAPAQLSGTVADADGDPLQIRWLRSTFDGGDLASCTFSGPTGFAPVTPAGLEPQLTCTQPGKYLMQLVVADGTSSFDSTGALVTVTPNHPPTVDSGPSVTVPAGTTASLSGSASDPDGDPLEIDWFLSVVSGPGLAGCTFTGPTSWTPLSAVGLTPMLTCPTRGKYLVQLEAADGLLDADDTGALVTFTDPTPATCRLVQRRGWPAPRVRIEDAESKVAAFSTSPTFNLQPSPSSGSYAPPKAFVDVKVPRVFALWAGRTTITHTNGDGVVGSCGVRVSRSGKVTLP